MSIQAIGSNPVLASTLQAGVARSTGQAVREQSGINEKTEADTRQALQSVEAQKDASSTNTEQDKKKVQESAKEAASKLQDFVSSVGTSLRFSVDDDSGQTVIKVLDPESQKVLRQIPSEEALALSKALDNFKGLLVRQKA